jgi:ABC-type xylose transport system permease subunit
LSKRQFTAAVVRTAGAIAAALVCSAFVQHLEHPWLFALRVGLVIGTVTAVGNAMGPFIEYFSENMPARIMGAFGIGLIFVGFSLQSLQYWLVVLDVPVK